MKKLLLLISLLFMGNMCLTAQTKTEANQTATSTTSEQSSKNKSKKKCCKRRKKENKAIIHNAPNQRELDSLKLEKAKGKY